MLSKGSSLFNDKESEPMSKKNQVYFVNYASDLGGPNQGSADGPILLSQSPFMAELKQYMHVSWGDTISSLNHKVEALENIASQCTKLAKIIYKLADEKKFFIVLGGDHTSAIGTWSGAASAYKKIGLIWIDAHLDSHTFETTESGNIHGMPLACLLGFGHPHLTYILSKNPKIQPQNVCLIGIRSFEKGERKLLDSLQVRIFDMEEITRKGLASVMQEAISIAKAGTDAYGISLDIDSIDPKEAPGTDVTEPNGLSAHELCKALREVAEDIRFIGAEIVEFDPHKDFNHITEKLIPTIILSLTQGL